MAISIMDVMNLVLLLPELLYIKRQNWTLSESLCKVYMGLDCFTNSGLIYTIIVLNLHLISYAKIWQNKQKMQECETESIDSFSESDDELEYAIIGGQSKEHLDTSSSKMKHFAQTKAFPSITYIIVLSLSISIPFFLFAQKLPNISNTNNSICGIKTFHQDIIASSFISIMVTLLRTILPIVLILITTITIICYLLGYQKFKTKEHIFFFKISFTISLFFILFSLQRLYFSLLFEIYFTPNKPFTHIKYPHVTSLPLVLLLTLMHYLSSLLRPFSVLLLVKCYKNSNSSAMTIRATNRTTSIKNNGTL